MRTAKADNQTQVDLACNTPFSFFRFFCVCKMWEICGHLLVSLQNGLFYPLLSKR